MATVIEAEKHPLDDILRADRIPHIWCPGCGIGIAMRCYAQAILDSDQPLDQHIVVSGIGCSGRPLAAASAIPGGALLAALPPGGDWLGSDLGVAA